MLSHDEMSLIADEKFLAGQFVDRNSHWNF